MRTLLAWLPAGADLDDDEFRRRHAVVRAVLWLHVPVLVAVGVVNGFDAVHLAVDVGAVLVLALMATAGRTRMMRSLSASLGVLAGAAALIHLTNGAIEAHFHLFVVLVFVALYQDWRALGGTVLFTVVHHIGVSIVDPVGAFSHPAAQAKPVLWAMIHALFVVFEVIGILLLWKATEGAQTSADEAAELAAQAALGREAAEALNVEQRQRAADQEERRELEAASADEARRRAERLEHAASSIRQEAADMKQTAQSLASQIHTAVGDMEVLSGGVDRIDSNVQLANDVAADGVRAATETDATMQQLSNASAEIDEIVGVISTIAAQTNLLALNATIEAARAGEAGRGFAVVASEVKELASQTGDATDDIDSRVASIAEAAQDAGTALVGIREVIDKISATQADIVAAIQDQTRTSEQVTTVIVKAAQDASQVTSSADHLSSLVEDILAH
ncbi:MAG: methyl-accepting chemotaxis protein [Acidimicrobiales bacterium]